MKNERTWKQPFDALPIPLMLEVTRLCRDFERAWRAGQSPQIEDFICRIAEEGRTAALCELIAQEVELRWAVGPTAEREEFHRRFPHHTETVNAAFALIEQLRPVTSDPPDTESLPNHLGRFRIERQLGRGAFGTVYLARDGELDRLVAIKVPHPERFSSPEEMDNLMAEARTAAQLTNPGIVTIYEVGRDGTHVFIVQEYIDGQDLGKFLKAQPPGLACEKAARLMSAIADAVAFAHVKGFVHRDLKPANILMDARQRPRVADFGLAVHETIQRRRKGELSGTPAYMSPEQVRGETHRLDGRSDIWSLGVILYEMLTGRRPFGGERRSELFDEIQHRDPKPPRQIHEEIPSELERICLKCLSKRVTDRYSSALDLSSELQHWLASGQQLTVSAARPVQVVPKGLRSFDEADAGFFLDLLPGPRDREGLPESIRFWKTRMEETDADDTFAVGLVYGPSGCGKSSLAKAGLLPRLAAHVLPIYVEATAEDTEVRVLKGLRKVCPEISAEATLPDMFGALREGVWQPRGTKIVIVLDQFEQWLHARTTEAGEQLIQALRQCDGGRLQAIVMVRDDFWMAATRFMRELEVRLLEGQNSAAVDLFDLDHARKVLAAFGRAFGKLPENPGDHSKDQREFLNQAVAGLAQEGKVISVQLALFAEMMKGKAWTPASLKEVGGTQGVGVTFLEETFSAATAPPAHRYHQKAARAVLKALLPDSGTDIKGYMRSYAELLEASSYARQSKDFDDLLRILDTEIRLITPTDPEGKETEGDAAPQSKPGQKYYQLTHDYLVPSLRDWLTLKQKETRRGRAELRLAERSGAWNAKPENRHLPSVVEWLNIRCLTHSAKWSDSQRKMMRQAAKVHATVWGSALAVLLMVGVSIQQYAAALQRRTDASNTTTAIDAIQSAVGEAVPFTIEKLDSLPRVLVKAELNSRFGAASGQQRLSLSYALAHFSQVEVDAIVAGILDPDTQPSEVQNIVTALKPATEQALPKLKVAASSASNAQDWEMKTRLATVAMYLGETSLANEMLQAVPPETSTPAELPNLLERPVHELVPRQPPWDPIQRTTYIAKFPTWCGEVEPLAKQLRDANIPHLRSGISLAVGGIDRPSADAKTAWREVWATWFAESPDSGTHSAADWALRQWNLEIPLLQPAGKPPGQKDWWHARPNLTMLKIRHGQVTGKEGSAKIIKLTEDFWLSDREISIGLFQQFMKEEADPQKRPADWPGAFKFEGIDDEHPVQNVSWEDAVMFCNWLSSQSGLDESYEITPREKSDDLHKFDVTLRPVVDGFRLPTEAEWEYACRARTTTDYACGDDEGRLAAYAVFVTSNTQRCASKLCNAWGLFDMHGNVWESCWDTYDAEGSMRVYRGGCRHDFARNCRSSIRNGYQPPYRQNHLGFRVARGPCPSASPASSGAESGSR